MKPLITIRKALCDDALLGRALGGPSWAAWRVLLIAAMGEALSDAERETFKALTGREREPLERVEELVGVIGRRGGKSQSMAALAVYVAALCDHVLAPGERGVALAIAPDQRQAGIVLDFAVAMFEGSELLSQLIANRTADGLLLNNGVSLEVRSASFRRLRGPTYVCVVADEAAFWFSDEFSANVDREILNAVRPGLSTTRGLLAIVSSPHARRGVVWEAYKRHFGADGDPLILVAQGASRTFNPLLPQSVVDRAMERDRSHATAEYLAEFRSDLEAFVSLDVVESCVGDYTELAPASGQRYSAFTDPSGGSADSFTLAVSHRDGERIVIDAIRETKPPFSPEAVVDEFAAVLRTYRIATIWGDRYAGEWPREQFKKRGIEYRCSEKTKSDLFRDLLPLLNSGRIVLPKSERLVNQLTGLERRVSRGGRDSIDHGPNGHDDLANAVAGAADCVAVDREAPMPVFAFYTGQGIFPFDRPLTRLEREARTWSPPCTIHLT